mgnify:CR=1 FL=1
MNRTTRKSDHAENSKNPAKGARFEHTVRAFLEKEMRLKLNPKYSLDLGGKGHEFDLGCANPPVIVECKRHTWTRGNNVPSAKLAVWNEAMLYFLLAPKNYKKILAVLVSRNLGGKSLADYYVDRFRHLVPQSVEIWEIDPSGLAGRRVYPTQGPNHVRSDRPPATNRRHRPAD